LIGEKFDSTAMQADCEQEKLIVKVAVSRQQLREYLIKIDDENKPYISLYKKLENSKIVFTETIHKHLIEALVFEFRVRLE
jgi:hypothetical protein